MNCELLVFCGVLYVGACPLLPQSDGELEVSCQPPVNFVEIINIK